jgi:hypothetical protein
VSIDAQAFITAAVDDRSFTVPTTSELPAAELDGQPFDFLAMLYALLHEPTGPTLPPEVSMDDYERARELVREARARRLERIGCAAAPSSTWSPS